MNKSIAFLFAGQGSQYYGMGYDLYKENIIFRDMMDYMDFQIQSISGYSILRELYNPTKRGDVLDDIAYSHPSIFMIEVALAKVLSSMNIRPNYVLGASLGEMASLVLAEYISLEQAIKLILKQIYILKKYCNLKNGMMTILASYNKLKHINFQLDTIEISAINCKDQFVVSGSKEELLRLNEILSANNILSYILPINYAFHSSMMENIKEHLNNDLQNKLSMPNEIEVISCVEGKKIAYLPNDYIWKVLRSQINFPKAIEILEKEDINMYIDLSPSGTLANFTKRLITCKDSIYINSIITPFKNAAEQLTNIYDYHIFTM